MKNPKPTWIAIIVCVLSVLPGLIVGALGSYLYKIFVSHDVGSDPDFFLMRTIFGIETPGKIIKWLFYEGFPNFVHGLIAGVVAISITEWFCPQSNNEIAAYTTGALFTGLVVALILIHSLVFGPTANIIASLAQLFGLWVGLFSALTTRKLYSQHQ